MTNQNDNRSNPIRCQWASQKHMEWLGNAHLVAGAMHIIASKGRYPVLIVDADVLRPTGLGDGPWATQEELRTVARDQACDLAVFLWDNEGEPAHQAEIALRRLGYDELADTITGRWLMAQPGDTSWAEAYRQARQDVDNAFPGVASDGP